MNINEVERQVAQDTVWAAKSHKEKQAAMVAVGAFFSSKLENKDVRVMLELLRLPLTYAADFRKGMLAGQMMAEMSKSIKANANKD